MKRIFSIVLVLSLALSLSAAVSESGKDAYELGRAVVGLLSYNEMQGTRFRGDDVLVESIESLRPEWDKPHYEEYFRILDKAGVAKMPELTGPASLAWRTEPELLGIDGHLISASNEIRGKAAWFHSRARGYNVTYSLNGEIMEYGIDGDIYFLLYFSGKTAEIVVKGERLRIGERALKDASLEVSVDLQSMAVDAAFNGRKLSGDDMAVLTPVVMKAAEFF